MTVVAQWAAERLGKKQKRDPEGNVLQNSIYGLKSKVVYILNL